MTEHPKCEQRIDAELAERLADLRKLWEAYIEDPDREVEDLGRLDEYGLCFDYVEPHTFPDQPWGFWRYQLSWGGPSDEFRLYGGGRIEYRFHDWFDGAGRDLEGDDLELLTEIFKDLLSCQKERHGF